MSVNKNKPHVLVLPEDDADRQLATGFESQIATRQFQVLQPANGWQAVLEAFDQNEVAGMRRWTPHRHLVLVIDFDGHPERLQYAKTKIPEDVRERVYIVGSLTDPQRLRAHLRKDLETIGQELATDCRNDTSTTCSHKLLHHNATELARLRTHVRSILFP